MSFELFPQTYVHRSRRLSGSERGLWFSKSLNLLLLGYLDKDGYLVAKVIHDGLTQEDCDAGRYWMSSFSTGYRYNNWDLHDYEFLGGWNTFLTLKGYLDFLMPASYEQIQAYFKAKRLVLDLEQSKRDREERKLAHDKLSK
jgi:hypothetical protein